MVKIKQKNVRGFGFVDRTTFLGVYIWPHCDLLDTGEFQCLEENSGPETIVLSYQENWLIRLRENWIPILLAINYMCFEQIFSCLLGLCFLCKIQVIKVDLEGLSRVKCDKVHRHSFQYYLPESRSSKVFNWQWMFASWKGFWNLYREEVLGPRYVKKWYWINWESWPSARTSSSPLGCLADPEKSATDNIMPGAFLCRGRSSRPPCHTASPRSSPVIKPKGAGKMPK